MINDMLNDLLHGRAPAGGKGLLTINDRVSKIDLSDNLQNKGAKKGGSNSTEDKPASCALTDAKAAEIASLILIDVQEKEGRLVTSSRNLAVVFGKLHRNVLRDIYNIIKTSDPKFVEQNFLETSYITSRGVKQPEYWLTRDGCMLLTMGYTGPKAMQIKTAYIQRFSEMEAVIRARSLTTLPDFEDPIKAAEAWIEAKKAERAAIAERDEMRAARDEAIRTKSQIGSKREATAMRNASLAAKEIKRLAAENIKLKDRLKEFEEGPF